MGVFIDETDLSWTAHIDNLCSFISSKNSLLKQLLTNVPVEIKKNLLYHILPLIDYGSNTWGTTSKHNIERISELQKRAARIILKADYNILSSVMFTQLGWATIPNRHDFNKAVLTYKAMNNLTPEYITDLLKPVSETHNRNLRSVTCGSLSVPRPKTALCDGSFSATAPKLWNALRSDIRTCSSLDNYKKSAKIFL